MGAQHFGTPPAKLQSQPLQVSPEARAHLRVLQRELHLRLQEAVLAAAVVPLSLVQIRVHPFACYQLRDAVGELDFAAAAAGLVADGAEDASVNT